MNPVSRDDLERIQTAFSTLAREVDIPYWTSPPVQFVYESTATLALGAYTWLDTPTALTTTRPILENALYYIRNVSLTADTAELDFTANIDPAPPAGTTGIPEFRVYVQSDSQAVLFREPLLMNKFFNQFDYRLWWMSHQDQDAFLAGFRGRLLQGGGLVGKSTVTLKAVISAQEIVDESFIDLFKAQFPTAPQGVRRIAHG